MVLTMIALGFTACSDDEETEVAVDPGIVGEWKVTSGEVFYNDQDPVTFITELAQAAGMNEADMEDAVDKAERERDGIDQVGGTHIFEADNTYSFKYLGDDNLYGETWAVDGRTLTLTYRADEDGSDYEVREITNQRATLVYTGEFTVEDMKAYYGLEVEEGIEITTLFYLEK